MTADSLYVAMALGVAILVASMISVEIGLSVSVIEIVLGVLLGNTLHLSTPDWLVFLATFGSVVLTFLAGAEVDPGEFRATWRASLLIGGFSFASPFVAAMLACRYIFGWDWQAAQIGGIALSTTSLAVVYAVLIETGLNATTVGKQIMSATFVTDLGTVLALSALFIRPNWWLIPFIGVSAVLILTMPRLDRWFFARYGDRVIESVICPPQLSSDCSAQPSSRRRAQAARPDLTPGMAHPITAGSDVGDAVGSRWAQVVLAPVMSAG